MTSEQIVERAARRRRLLAGLVGVPAILSAIGVSAIALWRAQRPSALGAEQGLWFWAAALVGGIIGALLLATLFDWALIGLSALAGATVVIDALHPGPAIAWLGLVALFIVGAAAQISMMRREKHTSTGS